MKNKPIGALILLAILAVVAYLIGVGIIAHQLNNDWLSCGIVLITTPTFLFIFMLFVMRMEKEAETKYDLFSVLAQPGHPGMIEGVCRIHLPKQFDRMEAYMKADYDEDVEVSFAVGIVGLGTYTFQIGSCHGKNNEILGGSIFLEETRRTILVEIETGLYDLCSDLCHFRAVLCKKDN